MSELTVHLPRVAFQSQAQNREQAHGLLRELAEAYQALSKKIRHGKIFFSVDHDCPQGTLIPEEPLVKTLNNVPDKSLKRFLFTFLVNRAPASHGAHTRETTWIWPSQTPEEGYAASVLTERLQPEGPRGWLVVRQRPSAPSTSDSLLVVERESVLVPVCWNLQSASRWIPEYDENAKHPFVPDADVQVGNFISPMDLRGLDAQEALDQSTLINRRRYTLRGENCYIFHAHRPEAQPPQFHGFKVPAKYLSDQILVQLGS